MAATNGGGGGGHLQRGTIQSMTLTLKQAYWSWYINCSVVTTEKYLWFYIRDDMPPL